MLTRRCLPLLFAIGGCAARPVLEVRDVAAGFDWSRATPIDVALDDHSFAPSTLRLQANAPYRLVLANRGAKAHDFTAPAFFRTAATRPGDPVATAMRAAGGRVDVGAGETRELAVVPLTAGSYALECVKPLHAMFGMEGEIIVAG